MEENVQETAEAICFTVINHNIVQHIVKRLFRAASSQMGTGQVPAAGGNAAAAAHRRREQEQGYEEALASTLGSSGNTGQAFSAAGDAYFAAGDAYSAAGGAASSHRRREHAGFLEPHHQAPGFDFTVYMNT